jgi:hypothetical protein
VGALAAGGALAIRIASSDPPSGALLSARSALHEARGAEASRYARAELERAESSFLRANRAFRKAEERWLGFREYEEVARKLESARRNAMLAAEVARRRRGEHSARAREWIDAAELELNKVRREVRRVPFANQIRSEIVHAEVVLGQARALLGRAEYPLATEQALVARTGLSSLTRRIETYLAEYTTGRTAELWRRWAAETIAESRHSGGAAVLVDKMARRCHLYRAGRRVHSYPADLGGRPLVQKSHAGDLATPEGRYRITEKRDRGRTRYYKALMLDYPNEEDRRRFARAKRNGWLPRNATVGGLIEIHGEGGRNDDWTLGCVALGNSDMDHLFDRVAIGTPVTIVGSLGSGS